MRKVRVRRSGLEEEEWEDAILQANRLVEALPEGREKAECRVVLREVDFLVKRVGRRGKIFQKIQNLLNYLADLKEKGLDRPDPLYEEAGRKIQEAQKLFDSLPDYLKGEYQEEKSAIQKAEELRSRDPRAASRLCEQALKSLSLARESLTR